MIFFLIFWLIFKFFGLFLNDIWMTWLQNDVSFKITFSTQEYLTANPAKEEDPEEEIEEIEEIEEEEEAEEVVDHEAELKDVQPANKELESVLKFFHPECNATCIVLKMSWVFE